MKTDFPPDIDELIEEFDEAPDQDERFEILLELARELPELEARYQRDENLVHGCMSTVWLVLEHGPATANSSGSGVVIKADSDALLVKGLIVLLLSFYQSKSPAEIVQADEKQLFQKVGLDQHLSPNRRNGLFSMVQRIKQLAAEVEASRA